MAATRKTAGTGLRKPAAKGVPSKNTERKDPPPIHVRVGEDDKDAYAKIAQRWGYKNEAVMHRKAAEMLDRAQQVAKALHGIPAGKLSELEQRLLAMLELTPAERSVLSENLTKFVPVKDSENLQKFLHVRISWDDKRRYEEIAGRWGFDESGALHRIAPYVLDRAHEASRLALEEAAKRALSKREDELLRQIDPERWLAAIQHGPLTKAPGARS
jgi:hypothetical protein